MRRSIRKGEKVSSSEELPESDSTKVSEPSRELVRSSWMPQFRFVQSSPHSGVTNVNGESEVVHWVVKDRPFSLRVLELPSASFDGVPEANQTESANETELSWSEVEVEADVVYTRTHQPVKPSTGHSPMSLDRSVIPPNVYNHRRSANLLDQQSVHGTSSSPKILKLKEGAGIELLVRLSILSSHLRNDFCIQLKLYIRQQLVAVWYSDTIRSVSKWDKVRHLQDSSSLPSSSHHSRPKSHSHRPSSNLVVTAPSKFTATHPAPSVSVSTKTTQKPVSSDIARADPNESLPQDDDDGTSSTTSGQNSQPSINQSSRPSTASSSSRYNFSSLDKDDRSQSYAKGGKKKKASGEEVFEMLEQLKSNLAQLQDCALPSTATNKKRRASWEPSNNGYPTEQEVALQAQRSLSTASKPSSSPSSATTGAQRFKKFKITEAASEIQHKMSPMGDSVAATAPVAFAKHVIEFLGHLDTMPLAEVRNALRSVLLTRPDLAASLARLLKFESGVAQQGTPGAATASTNHHQSQLTADLTPNGWTRDVDGLSTSAHMIGIGQSGLWNDERYGLGPNETVEVSHVHEDVVPAAVDINCAAMHDRVPAEQEMVDSNGMTIMDTSHGVYDDPSSMVLSPSAFDDDSTTMGSPNSYSSWGDEWQPGSNTSDHGIASHLHQPFQLTDSSMFSGLETAGF